MLTTLAGLLLAVVLFLSATAKAADRDGARGALGTYGLTAPPAARAAWASLVLGELLLAAGVAADQAVAEWAACALLSLFVAAQVTALAAGRGGAPCGCLGGRGRLGARSVLRAAALTALAAGVALAPRGALTTEQWLGVGLAVALLGVLGLGVVVLALAREIGALRLTIAPQAALEVPSEGPEIGARIALADEFGDDLAGGRLGLAVFTSEGCAMCRALSPVVGAFGRNSQVSLRTFDELAHAAAWSAADVPGSPYAVALDADGAVLAKGTFNTGAQLESVLATAERRRADRADAHVERPERLGREAPG